MKNALICAARSAYYAVTEPIKLKNARIDNLDGVDGVWNHGDPLVSVIIPTHERIELLTERALQSVFTQTYRRVEVLICAHGSMDHYLRVIRAATDSRIWGFGGMERRVLHVPRKPKYPPTAENHWFAGPVDPINAGLKAANGHWIARIDDDDTWEPQHIERLLRFAQQHDYEFVSSAYRTDHGVVPHDGHERAPIGGVQTWLYRGYLTFMRANPDCWRKTWNKVNDTDLADRFRKAGVRIGHFADATARVSPRPGETVIGLKAYQQNRAETERKLAFR